MVVHLQDILLLHFTYLWLNLLPLLLLLLLLLVHLRLSGPLWQSREDRSKLCWAEVDLGASGWEWRYGRRIRGRQRELTFHPLNR